MEAASEEFPAGAGGQPTARAEGTEDGREGGGEPDPDASREAEVDGDDVGDDDLDWAEEFLQLRGQADAEADGAPGEKRRKKASEDHDPGVSETDTSAESSTDDDDDDECRDVGLAGGGHFLLGGEEEDVRFRQGDFVWEGGDDWWLREAKDEEEDAGKDGLLVGHGGEEGRKRYRQNKQKRKRRLPEDLADFIDDSDGHEDEGELEEDDEDELTADSEDSDDSYKVGGGGKYRRGRGRGRPRKRRKVFSADDPLRDWDVRTHFECRRCGRDLVGFQAAVDHMDAHHPLEPSAGREDWFQCPLCPKPFARKDHLKRHVEGHVEGRIPRGGEADRSSKRRMLQAKRRAMKEEEDAAADAKNDEDWSTYQVFRCHRCGKHLKNFRNTWIHMRNMHPRTSGTAIESDLSDDDASRAAATVKIAASSEYHKDEEEEEFEHEGVHIIEGIGDDDDVDDEEEDECEDQDCYRCVVCGRSYRRRDHLKTHVWRHVNAVAPTPMHQTRKYTKSWAETNWWKCKLCPDSTPEICGLNALVDHNKSSHGMSTGFVCPVCDKSGFRTKGLLRAHVMTHNVDKKPCEFCGKLFADGQKMKRHVNEVHSRLRNHMCNTCGKTFARKDKLRAHELAHLDDEEGNGGVKAEGVDQDEEGGGERTHLCHKCGRGFARQEQVSRHLKTCGVRQRKRGGGGGSSDLGTDLYEKDSETGLYQCRQCDHKFKNKHYMAEHFARNHRQENLRLPFRCDLCGKGYKVMKDLVRHQNRPNVHNEKYMKKQFICPNDGCAKRFGRQHELKKHLKWHQGIRDLKCEHCDATFHIRQCLKAHMKRLHGLKLPPPDRSTSKRGDGQRGDGGAPGGEGGEKRRRRRKKEAPSSSAELPTTTLNIPVVPAARQQLQQQQQWPQLQQQGQAEQQQQQGATAASVAGEVTFELQQAVAGAASRDTGQSQVSTFAQWMSGLEQQQQQQQQHGITTAFQQATSSSKQHPPPTSTTPADSVQSFQPDDASSSGAFDPVRAALEWSDIDGGGAHQPPSSLTLPQSEGVPKAPPNRNVGVGGVPPPARGSNPRGGGGGGGAVAMSEEERQRYAEQLRRSKAGAICTVCGKIFRNRDALHTHVMTTRMPGHELAQMRRLKSDYAFASMEVSARLGGPESGGETPVSAPDAGPATPHNSLLDPETGCAPASAAVKQEGGGEGSVFSNVKAEEGFEAPLPDIKLDELPPSPPHPATAKREASSSRPFMCMDCSKGFRRLAKLMRHVEKHHQSKTASVELDPGADPADVEGLVRRASECRSGRWPCVICGKLMGNKQKLQRHLLEVHQKLKSHVCRVCQQCFARLDKLKLHEKSAHDEEELRRAKPLPTPLPADTAAATPGAEPQLRITPLGCPDCWLQFADEESILEHMDGPPHIDTAMTKDQDVTEKATTSKEATEAESGVSIKQEEGACTTGQDVIQSGGFSSVKDDPQGTGDILCPVLTCNRLLVSRAKLAQHLRLGKHNQPCPACGKVFARLDKLELHLRSHSTDKPLKCPMCDLSFKDKNALYYHKRTTHSNLTGQRKETFAGDRSHLCADCGRGFSKADHLRRHRDAAHTEGGDGAADGGVGTQGGGGRVKNVKCRYCDKVFFDKYKAKIHERKHTGEAPYLCQICAKAFKRKEALDQHAIVHKDGPKEFKCLTCSATFKSQQYLNRHVTRHFAERNHRCEKCGAAFIDRRDLATHDRHVHQNLRPFVCEHCGSAYKTKQALTIHSKAYPTGDCVSHKRFSGRGANRIDAGVAALNDVLSKKEDSTPTANTANPSKESAEKSVLKCPECDQVFEDRSRLEWHYRARHEHPSERAGLLERGKAFACDHDGCGRAFAQAQSLRNHLRTVHKVLPAPAAPSRRGKKSKPAADPPPQRNASSHALGPVEARIEVAKVEDGSKVAQNAAAAAAAAVQIQTRFPADFLPKLDLLARTPQPAAPATQQPQQQQILQPPQTQPPAPPPPPLPQRPTPLPQIMLQHHHQLFHHHQQQQQQQQHRQQQQHSLLQAPPQPPPMIQHPHPQMAALPPAFVSPPNPSAAQHYPMNDPSSAAAAAISMATSVQQQQQQQQPSPSTIDFYQYAANFANINIYHRN